MVVDSLGVTSGRPVIGRSSPAVLPTRLCRWIPTLGERAPTVCSTWAATPGSGSWIGGHRGTIGAPHAAIPWDRRGDECARSVEAVGIARPGIFACPIETRASWGCGTIMWGSVVPVATVPDLIGSSKGRRHRRSGLGCSGGERLLSSLLSRPSSCPPGSSTRSTSRSSLEALEKGPGSPWGQQERDHGATTYRKYIARCSQVGSSGPRSGQSSARNRPHPTARIPAGAARSVSTETASCTPRSKHHLNLH